MRIGFRRCSLLLFDACRLLLSSLFEVCRLSLSLLVECCLLSFVLWCFLVFVAACCMLVFVVVSVLCGLLMFVVCRCSLLVVVGWSGCMLLLYAVVLFSSLLIGACVMLFVVVGGVRCGSLSLLSLVVCSCLLVAVGSCCLSVCVVRWLLPLSVAVLLCVAGDAGCCKLRVIVCWRCELFVDCCV